MKREIKIGESFVGDGHPTYIVGEIGINHNGDLEIAKQLIDVEPQDAAVAEFTLEEHVPDPAYPSDNEWLVEPETFLLRLDIGDGDL